MIDNRGGVVSVLSIFELYIGNFIKMANTIFRTFCVFLLIYVQVRGDAMRYIYLDTLCGSNINVDEYIYCDYDGIGDYSAKETYPAVTRITMNSFYRGCRLHTDKFPLLKELLFEAYFPHDLDLCDLIVQSPIPVTVTNLYNGKRTSKTCQTPEAVQATPEVNTPSTTATFSLHHNTDALTAGVS